MSEEISEVKASPAGETEIAASTEAARKSVKASKAAGDIHDLEIGQELAGKVKSITDFGAFVEIGIDQDGLVHISELSRKHVEHVSDLVHEGDEVKVWVKNIDTKRGRISLTMVKPITRRLKDINEGDILEGTISRIEDYGAFVDLDMGRDGLIHISEITHDYINNPKDVFTIGQAVTAKVLKIDRKKRQVDLSTKALMPEPAVEERVVETAAEEAAPAEEENSPSIMAVAFMEAMGKSRKDSGVKIRQQAKTKKQKAELSNLILKTLNSHKS